jgi:FkbM family methyltransferase
MLRTIEQLRGTLTRRRLFRAPAEEVPPAIVPADEQSGADPRRLEQLVPIVMTAEDRIAMATRCRDCDALPKVPGAGGIQLDPDGRRIQIMHNGIRVMADGYYGPWMTRLIEQCGGHHEPQEERIFHEVVSRLPPGGTILELGGFWAFYSIWFLRSGAGRRALLLEPDPSHIAVGSANFALNDVAARIVQGFVGGTPGRIREFQTEESGLLTLLCFDVATLMATHDIDRLTILHCDVQGAEFSVLEQAAPLLRAGRIDWVFVSTHHHSISGDPITHQRCLALLRALGAQIEAEHDVQESFSGDGLICARFCDAPPGWEPGTLSRNRASESLFRHPLYDLAVAMAPPSGQRVPPVADIGEAVVRGASPRP